MNVGINKEPCAVRVRCALHVQLIDDRHEVVAVVHPRQDGEPVETFVEVARITVEDHVVAATEQEAGERTDPDVSDSNTLCTVSRDQLYEMKSLADPCASGRSRGYCGPGSPMGSAAILFGSHARNPTRRFTASTWVSTCLIKSGSV